MQTDNKTLIVYGDLISQPVRAVICFLSMNKIPFEFKQLRIFKGEQKSEEFKKINPNMKLPAITDNTNGVNLFESHTILKYIKATRKVADHWYPDNDVVRRAKIDEYLDWHHSNIREGALGYLIQRFGNYQNPDQMKLNQSLNAYKKALRMLESYWLKDENQKQQEDEDFPSESTPDDDLQSVEEVPIKRSGQKHQKFENNSSDSSSETPTPVPTDQQNEISTPTPTPTLAESQTSTLGTQVSTKKAIVIPSPPPFRPPKSDKNSTASKYSGKARQKREQIVPSAAVFLEYYETVRLDADNETNPLQVSCLETQKLGIMISKTLDQSDSSATTNTWTIKNVSSNIRFRNEFKDKTSDSDYDKVKKPLISIINVDQNEIRGFYQSSKVFNIVVKCLKIKDDVSKEKNDKKKGDKKKSAESGNDQDQGQQFGLLNLQFIKRESQSLFAITNMNETQSEIFEKQIMITVSQKT